MYQDVQTTTKGDFIEDVIRRRLIRSQKFRRKNDEVCVYVQWLLGE